MYTGVVNLKSIRSTALLLALPPMISACGVPSKSDELARVINALVRQNLIDVTDPPDGSNPITSAPWFRCNGYVYTYGVSKFSFSGTIGSTLDVAVLLQGNIVGDNLFPEPPYGREYGQECRLNASWTFDAASARVLGGGTITTCDNFACNANGENISCDTMTTALLENECETIFFGAAGTTPTDALFSRSFSPPATPKPDSKL